MHKIELFKDYENAKLDTVEEYRLRHKDATYRFEDICKKEIDGIPICVTKDKSGKLDVTFIPDSHVLAIGATRSGKTTGYVIPTLNILMKKKNKPNLVISDPKQELYSNYAEQFRQEGYDIKLLDFTNYSVSDCWNPLTKIFREYQKQFDVPELITRKRGLKKFFEFNGTEYDSYDDAEAAIREYKTACLDEAEKDLTSLCNMVVPVSPATKDPFWDCSARDLLHAILLGMLEDSGYDGDITEDNFSFDTVLRIFDSFSDSVSDVYDKGFFTNRSHHSKAYQLAGKCILEQAKNTRLCISSSFAAAISKFRDISIRRVTCTNTIDFETLDEGDRPTVIFLSYKDEESLHYEIISLFLSDLYTALIGVARKKNSKLDTPFYFLLDEFGNLPRFEDFDKVISACGGRNIWFLLILQSYAQLNNVYGRETADIIKDNLNVHIFFGTNNPQTKRDFSEECGHKTVISPISALNGKGESIVSYDKDTVALVPVSALNHIAPGECIITQMRENVLWSRIERSYNCPEFAPCGKKSELSSNKVVFSDPKYRYEIPQ